MAVLENVTVLELDRLCLHFELTVGFVDRVIRRKPSNYIKAVESLSVTVGKNEILGIAGESGCGKSTTCNMVSAEIKPNTS